MKAPLLKTPLFVLVLTLTVCVSVLAQTIVFPGRVVNVADGDTVTVLTRSNTEFRVRCQGIHAPKGQENSAAESKHRLSELLLDEAVTVRYIKRDPDGTLVGAILLNDLNICLDQVKEGMARYDDRSDQSRSTQELYANAESSARKYRMGLWRSSPLETDSSLPAPVVVSPDTNTSVPDQRLLTTSSSDAISNTTVNVRGYFRKDGTYVAGYKRTAPDGNSNNNWSTQGNINPYTGQVGTTKQSRWISVLKLIGVGAALGAMMYLDAKYPSATARCNDGTYSYSLHRQGTCSHHGGVAYWLR
jgi:endonuclease YncB( thermonuclease family)